MNIFVLFVRLMNRKSAERLTENHLLFYYFIPTFEFFDNIAKHQLN